MSNFAQSVAQSMKDNYAAFVDGLEQYAPSTELNRRKWNESKNNMGELYRLSETYGNTKMTRWVKYNKARDLMEARND